MIVNREDASMTAVRECRLHFLRAAAEHPDIRLGESLREKVFKPSRRLWAELGLPVPQKPSGAWTAEQHDALPTFCDEEARLIGEWAASHNLEYDWVHEAGRDALMWESFPDRPFAIIPGYQPPTFTWTRWYFEHECETEYRKRIEADFQETLDAYIRAVKGQRRQFLTDRESQATHYRWSVEHVCLGWGWSHIVRKNAVHVTWQAVSKAVRQILERVEIPQGAQPTSPRKRTF